MGKKLKNVSPFAEENRDYRHLIPTQLTDLQWEDISTKGNLPSKLRPDIDHHLNRFKGIGIGSLPTASEMRHNIGEMKSAAAFLLGKIREMDSVMRSHIWNHRINEVNKDLMVEYLYSFGACENLYHLLVIAQQNLPKKNISDRAHKIYTLIFALDVLSREHGSKPISRANKRFVEARPYIRAVFDAVDPSVADKEIETAIKRVVQMRNYLAQKTA